MSQETIEWLNTYTLQSRKVWHTDANLQKFTNTVYDGAIPVDDVLKRLFAWETVEAGITADATILTADGVQTLQITDPDRKAILRPPGALSDQDPGAILGIFTQGYKPHSYAKWLIENVAHILDDDLAIYSAGLLRQGAQAWVQVTIPDTITTPEGVEFRPNLLAVTSFDGSLATTYKKSVRNAVCDNTMALVLIGAGESYKLKHTRYSDLKIMDAREALAMVHTIADDFSAQVAELTAQKVTDKEFEDFLNSLSPLTDAKGDPKQGRSLTLATNRQNELRTMWRNDTRVAPWRNTAYGVVQAVNTHRHHVASVRGMERDERNMSMAVTGDIDRLDASTLATLEAALA